MPKHYPREFRDDVVRVARNREPGPQVKQIAADFGIRESCLTNWLKNDDVETGAKPGVAASEHVENRELKKRMRLLGQEDEVLRRAAAYYDYDAIHRLASATTRQGDPDDGTGNDTTVRGFDYAYDRHSNLITETVTPLSGSANAGDATPGLETGTLWSVHNGGDEICAATRTPTTADSSNNPGLACGGTNANPSGATTYEHDSAGNMGAASGGTAATLGGLTLDYNLPGQTISIDAPGAGAGQEPRTQAYDGVMQDRRTTDGPTDMSYGFPAGVTSQNTTSDPVTGESHSEIFVRTPGGRLLAMLDYTDGQLSDTDARYFMLDDMKTVAATLPAAAPGTSGAGGDANPDAVRYLFEPYGQTIRSWVDPDPATAADAYTEDPAQSLTSDYNPFGYVSGYTDKATGLVKFGTRYYSPQLGTWTQADPEKGDPVGPLALNATLYVMNDPVNGTDMSGRFLDLDGLKDVIANDYDKLSRYIGPVGDAYEIATSYQDGGW